MQYTLLSFLIVFAASTFAAPNLEHVKEAFSLEVINSSERISYKPIYREVKDAISANDQEYKHELSAIVLQSFLDMHELFLLKDSDSEDAKASAIEDRTTLFTNLFGAMKEIGSDAYLKIAEKIRKINEYPRAKSKYDFYTPSFNSSLAELRRAMLLLCAHKLRGWAIMADKNQALKVLTEFIATAKLDTKETQFMYNRVGSVIDKEKWKDDPRNWL